MVCLCCGADPHCAKGKPSVLYFSFGNPNIYAKEECEMNSENSSQPLLRKSFHQQHVTLPHIISMFLCSQSSFNYIGHKPQYEDHDKRKRYSENFSSYEFHFCRSFLVRRRYKCSCTRLITQQEKTRYQSVNQLRRKVSYGYQTDPKIFPKLRTHVWKLTWVEKEEAILKCETRLWG